jgi:hypothetical protein
MIGRPVADPGPAGRGGGVLAPEPGAPRFADVTALT